MLANVHYQLETEILPEVEALYILDRFSLYCGSEMNVESFPYIQGAASS